MSRSLAVLAVVAALGGVAAESAQELEPSPSARVAAVRFAIQDGWKFPATNIIVSTQIDRGVMHARPVRGYTKEQTRFSEDIARLIGPDVKVSFPGKFLDCATDRGPCWAKSETAVLEVGEMLDDAPAVSVRLYSAGLKPGEPPTTRTAVLRLERRGTGWIGAGYSMGPTTLTRRR